MRSFTQLVVDPLVHTISRLSRIRQIGRQTLQGGNSSGTAGSADGAAQACQDVLSEVPVSPDSPSGGSLTAPVTQATRRQTRRSQDGVVLAQAGSRDKARVSVNVASAHQS